MRISSALGVSCGVALIRWPLRLMTTSCRPCSSRTILAMLIPVVSWRYRATARAAITIVRWASMASRVWWKTGRARRSCLLIGEGLLDVPQLVVGGDDLGGVTCFSVNVRFGWLDQTGLLGASWWWPPTGSTHCARPGPSALPD